jgi:hypothetical protein
MVRQGTVAAADGVMDEMAQQNTGVCEFRAFPAMQHPSARTQKWLLRGICVEQR